MCNIFIKKHLCGMSRMSPNLPAALLSLCVLLGCKKEGAIPTNVHEFVKYRKQPPHYLSVKPLNKAWTVWITDERISKSKALSRSYLYRYLLQARNSDNLIVAPFEHRGGQHFRPVWAFDDGTLVLFQVYPATIIVVEPSGKILNTVIQDIRLGGSDFRPDVLLATDYGFIMQADNLNNEEPIFLVPWKEGSRVPDFSKSKKVFSHPFPVNGMRFRIRWYGDTILARSYTKLYLYDIPSAEVEVIESRGSFGASDGTNFLLEGKEKNWVLHLPSRSRTQVDRKRHVLALWGDIITYSDSRKPNDRNGGKEIIVWNYKTNEEQSILKLAPGDVEAFQEGNQLIIISGGSYRRLRIEGLMR